MPVIFVSDCIGGLRIILHCSMEWSLIVTRELVGYVHIIQAQLVLPITNWSLHLLFIDTNTTDLVVVMNLLRLSY